MELHVNIPKFHFAHAFGLAANAILRAQFGLQYFPYQRRLTLG
jgi:hypothetical protein